MDKIIRLSKPEYICYLALAAASRSEDPFTKTGGVVVNKDWRVLNTGFNGVKAGQSIPNSWFLEKNRQEKSDLMIHAEQNIFNFIHDKPYAIGLTMAPCFNCSKMIVSHGIQEVHFIREYERDLEKKYRKVFDFYEIKFQILSKKNIQNILYFIEQDRNILQNLLK
jgi:dCMP deaminase